MKKSVHFAALFPLNLALITHNAPSSVNPSIITNAYTAIAVAVEVCLI